MRKRARIVFGTATAAVLLVGCVEKRVNWSPDGRWAVVIGHEGALHICDGDGGLSDQIAVKVRRVTWFPDSRHFLMLRDIEVKTWDEAAAVLSAEHAETLIAAAGHMRDDLLAFEGDMDDFKPSNAEAVSQAELIAAGLYVRDYLPEGIREKLGDDWAELEEMSATFQTLQAAEVSEGGAQLGAIVFQTLEDIGHSRISPDGATVAFTIKRGTDGNDELKLFVMPIGGGEPLEVADLVGQHVDWSADGTQIVFMRANVPIPDGSEALRLGALSRRAVRDDAGELLEKFGDVRDLAGIIFDDSLKLHVLDDDRVLFAANEVRLPATAKEMPQRQSLFTMDLNGAATVTRVLPRGTESQIASNLGFFEVSPDGTRISVPTDKGRVAVVVLATGEVIHVQPEDDKQDKLRTVPTWRNNDELCFAVPAGSEHGSAKRAEIVLWSAGGTRTISKSWPDSVVKDFLTLDKDEQQKLGEEMLEPVDP